MIKGIIFLWSAIMVLLLFSVTPVLGWTTSNLKIVTPSSDSYWNYDFESKTVSSTNVDWPVTVIHFNNAEVDKVKDIYWSGSGSKMYARINDGSGWVWDEDGGTKSLGYTTCCHMRVYADGDDMMYNGSYGYWVLGTTHYDIFEWNPWTAKFGWSEDAENEICDVAISKDYDVWEDIEWNFTRETFRVEGNHYWDNNGFASMIYVP